MSNGTISKILILLDNKTSDEIDELNLSLTNDIKQYEKYFTSYELDEINKIKFDKTELKKIIEFSNVIINLDDTIYMLCYKIRETLQIDNQLSEFYLYTYQTINLDDLDIDDYNYHLIKKLENTEKTISNSNNSVNLNNNTNNNNRNDSNYNLLDSDKINRYIHNNYDEKKFKDKKFNDYSEIIDFTNKISI